MINVLIYLGLIYLAVAILLHAAYFSFVPKVTRTVSPAWAALVCILWLFFISTWVKSQYSVYKTGKQNNRNLEGVLKQVSILLAVLVLSSCAPTLYQSQKQLNKVQHYHPVLIAQLCAKTFPVKFDTVRGPAVIIRRVDTVQGPSIIVDCDSLINSLPGPAVVAVKCPPSIIQHDSVFVPEIITIENTAKVSELQLKLDEQEGQAAKAKGSLSTWRGVAYTFMGLFVLACIGVGIAFKRKVI